MGRLNLRGKSTVLSMFSMFTIFKVIILVGLLKLYIETEKPLLCAGLYGVINGFIRVLVNATAFQILVGACGTFVLSLIYFGLLSRFETGTTWWWVILIGGFAIGLV